MIFLEPYRVLEKIYFEGARLKLALSSTPLGEKRGRTVLLVYSVLEHDKYLELCIDTFSERPPKKSVRLVLKIALAAVLYASVPRAVAGSEAVALTRKLGKGGAAGFVNAFLRRFSENEVPMPEGEAGISIRSNFPLFAVRRALEEYGERAERILTAKSHGVSVRFVRGLERYQELPREDTPFPGVKIFKTFTRDENFFAGDYTFQSVGSVAICEMVSPCDKLLDACAAPGGKSVLLAGKCGEVTACELHGHRTALIREYCARMGVNNVTAVQGDSSSFNPAFEGAFNGVLCDVPCSGFGTVSENPDLPLNKREEDFVSLGGVQRAILENCSRYVKRGGKLYYSTCSIFRAENDSVVGEFLAAHPEFELERADSPLAHDKTNYGVQFLPDTAFGAGFYMAVMKRK